MESLIVPTKADIDWYSKSDVVSPDDTVYLNTKVLLPDPLTYTAAVSVAPVSSVRVGIPVTITGSVNTIEMSTNDPTTSDPVEGFEVTDNIVGTVVSITTADEPPSEFTDPSVGNTKTALFKATSLMVPPASESDVVETYSKSDVIIGFEMVVVNKSVLDPDPEAYVATVSVVPVSSVRVGVPVTATDSENSTATVITEPTGYVPLLVILCTEVTTGAVESTIMFLRFESELTPPRDGSVSIAFADTLS